MMLVLSLSVQAYNDQIILSIHQTAVCHLSFLGHISTQLLSSDKANTLTQTSKWLQAQ